MIVKVKVSHKVESDPVGHALIIQAAVNIDELPTKFIAVTAARHVDGKERTTDEALDAAIAALVQAVVEQVQKG